MPVGTAADASQHTHWSLDAESEASPNQHRSHNFRAVTITSRSKRERIRHLLGGVDWLMADLQRVRCGVFVHSVESNRDVEVDSQSVEGTQPNSIERESSEIETRLH